MLDPATRHRLPVAVLGRGRLGRALFAALEGAGYRVEMHPAREAVAAARSVEAGLVFLAVPDGAVAAEAAALAWREGQAAVHCSGALGLDALEAATVAGALAGCLHPLQSFPAGAAPEVAAARWRGITCGIEAPEPLEALLEAIAGDLGARTVRLDGVDRAAYHAAAVLASNDVVALAAAAERAWALAGLAGGAREALAPLMRGAVESITHLPLAEALTGPVARGDIATVQRHLIALEAEPDVRELYRRLALELARLDLGHAAEVREALARLLETPEA